MRVSQQVVTLETTEIKGVNKTLVILTDAILNQKACTILIDQSYSCRDVVSGSKNERRRIKEQRLKNIFMPGRSRNLNALRRVDSWAKMNNRLLLSKQWTFSHCY